MGAVGGSRHYDGPGLGSGPWKCPQCGAVNDGPISAGCASCGSGSAPARKVGQPPSVYEARVAATDFAERAAVVQETTDVMRLAQAWVGAHVEASLVEAFAAGYLAALQRTRAHMMQAPPVTADLTTLAPEGKVRRTIIAALELFKDQILRAAPDEIASGEWCSVEEVETLIREMKEQEGEP